MKREAAVTKEMSKQLNDDKKISRKEKDERILWKKNEVFTTCLAPSVLGHYFISITITPNTGNLG